MLDERISVFISSPRDNIILSNNKNINSIFSVDDMLQNICNDGLANLLIINRPELRGLGNFHNILKVFK
jgi:hypothetical protein